MSYINADDVLPNILVKEIQKYVDGQLIYIPRKNENLLSWGEKIGICPSGFFLFAFGKRKIISGIIVSAMLSLCFEILQWIFALGASDITDLITNTVGGTFGTFMFFATGKLFKGHQVKIACMIGAILEAIFIILMIVLSVLNK